MQAFYRKHRQERPPRTMYRRGGGVGSVIANHRGGGENSVTVTRLIITMTCIKFHAMFASFVCVALHVLCKNIRKNLGCIACIVCVRFNATHESHVMPHASHA